MEPEDNKPGVIIRVSGPLVKAKGMHGVKMYEVVKISSKNLMGEVIEIDKDVASIQVYEDTSGIGPGEEVIRTGKTMSVELGPGLLESIYDGIQRPLQAIEKKSGSYVIARGIEAPGISRDRKWQFKPAKKAGDFVVEGDIVGQVKETALIDHKIMVPQGMAGKIEKINAGNFNVLETIAVIEKENKEKAELKMLQTWPIRRPRPKKEKIFPTAPLVSGIRIIDSFFPVAKGGTSSIPGAFGTGKCIWGEGPVLIADKGLKKIKDLFNEYKPKGRYVNKGREEYIFLNRPLPVFSYKDGKIVQSKATAIYKGWTDELLEIKTKTGRWARITPVHKLQVAGDNLSISEIEARNLKKGDFIAAPRRIERLRENKNIRESFVKTLQEERIVDQKALKEISKTIAFCASKFGDRKKLAALLNISYDNLIRYEKTPYKGINYPPVSFAKSLYKLAKKPFPSIKRLKTERRSHWVEIPERMTPKLAEFLGLLLGDGSLNPGGIHFYNNDENLRKRFRELAKEIFGVDSKDYWARTVEAVGINSRLLTRFVRHLGVPAVKKSRECLVPVSVFQADEKSIASFLAAYFVCDGYFPKNSGVTIEFDTASQEMAMGISYLFARVGIIGKLSDRDINRHKYFKVIVSGREQINRFCQLTRHINSKKIKKVRDYIKRCQRSYTSFDLVPISKEELGRVYAEKGSHSAVLKKAGVNIHNYLLYGEHLSVEMFRRIAKIFNNPGFLKIANNHLEHTFYDEIVEIKTIRKPQEVYDVSVPGPENFIGGFGPMFLHNTVTQQSLAKYCDAQVIVYVGCGERGNEMTEVLKEFPELIDPNTGEPLMKRTVLIANTSNMPVAAREASVYTGITIAEYYRDMGYSVALMADSTSRWAEAMREISGRLEEMPGEEGYPAYLSSRKAEFYERAGIVKCLGSDDRIGALTAVGAVSPPGGDLSEPVSQATLRVTKCFWGLDASLAYKKHFPAINWLNSYSLYTDNFKEYWSKNLGPDFSGIRAKAMDILQQEAKLLEIVRLVGMEALSNEERVVLEIAKSIREDFLFQNAFDKEDAYTPLKKQYEILKSIIEVFNLASEAAKSSEFDFGSFAELPSVKNLPQLKEISPDELKKHEEFRERARQEISRLSQN